MRREAKARPCLRHEALATAMSMHLRLKARRQHPAPRCGPLQPAYAERWFAALNAGTDSDGLLFHEDDRAA